MHASTRAREQRGVEIGTRAGSRFVEVRDDGDGFEPEEGGARTGAREHARARRRDRWEALASFGAAARHARRSRTARLTHGPDILFTCPP